MFLKKKTPMETWSVYAKGWSGKCIPKLEFLSEQVGLEGRRSVEKEGKVNEDTHLVFFIFPVVYHTPELSWKECNQNIKDSIMKHLENGGSS